MSRLLELSTGCRLHFGLLELAEGQPNRYGGLGLMLEQPCVRLRWRPETSADQPIITPSVELQRRVKLAHLQALSSLRQSHADELLDELGDRLGTMEVLECPPLHSGLGVGTQLATAVAKLTQLAVQTRLDQDLSHIAADVAGLAALSGRGKRSAIGLHGFQHGGLIRDLGYGSGLTADQSGLTGEPAPTVRPANTQAVALPNEWMVVLCCASASGDVHGQFEDQLIDRAAARPNPQRERMLQLGAEALQSAEAADFASFTMILDEYMELASRLFANVQGGRYRDSHTARRVECLRAVGLRGVGQSSWGPAVFGFAPHPPLAHAAAEQLNRLLDSPSIRVIVARPKSTGAQWSMSATGGRQHAG